MLDTVQGRYHTCYRRGAGEGAIPLRFFLFIFVFLGGGYVSSLETMGNNCICCFRVLIVQLIAYAAYISCFFSYGTNIFLNQNIANSSNNFSLSTAEIL